MIANENTATSLPSLWVAAAINADNEDPFFDSDEEAVSDDEEDYDASATATSGHRSRGTTSTQVSPPASPPVRSRQNSAASRAYGRSFSVLSSRRPSIAYAPFARYPSLTMTATETGNSEMPRRPSTPHAILPAIYANTGVTTPPAL